MISRLEEPSVRTLARRGRADGVEADEYRVVLEEKFLVQNASAASTTSPLLTHAFYLSTPGVITR